MTILVQKNVSAINIKKSDQKYRLSLVEKDMGSMGILIHLKKKNNYQLEGYNCKKMSEPHYDLSSKTNLGSYLPQ